jgi:uncharacterized protein (DUF1330 family)
MLVRHKVEEYAKWKPEFDEHGATRKAIGSKGGYLFRNIDDPNEVVVLIDMVDLQKAREFVQSEDLREAMQKSGVADQPDVYLLDEVDKPSA